MEPGLDGRELTAERGPAAEHAHLALLLLELRVQSLELEPERRERAAGALVHDLPGLHREAGAARRGHSSDYKFVFINTKLHLSTSFHSTFFNRNCHSTPIY